MQQIAEGVWQLSGFPPHAINCYLVGDVLIDAATRLGRRRVLGQLRGRRLSAVALTHCHPDHQGTAALVCRKYGAPLWCHEADADAMEGRAPIPPRGGALSRLMAGPPYPVDRRLRDGDEVAGFRVIHAPGHTPGHVVFFRDRDRTAIAGDLFNNLSFLPFLGLGEPPRFLSTDPELNRRSIRALAALRPALVCVGHGPPLRDMKLLERFAANL
jgi:glyoxylase-like metal-dependent hydrolase (beta-lactamase superfamily II)